MPIKVTYKNIQDPTFMLAVMRIKDTSFKNSFVAYNVLKIWRKLSIEMETAQEVYTKLLKRIAVLDDKGAFVPKKDKDGNDQPNSFKITPGKEEEFELGFKEYQAVTVELPCHPLTLDQLSAGEVPLSPSELDVLLGSMIEEPKEDAA